MKWFRRLFRDRGVGKACTCGKFDGECVRRVYATFGGTLYIKKGEHFKCGKVQNTINRLSDIVRRNKKIVIE